MANPYLLLWLEGPLQSWGFDSKFGRRETLSFPTKSGVLGLLACALGKSGEQREWLAQFADLDMQVIAYSPLNPRTKKTVAVDILRDFHMVGSGYDDQDPWQSMLIPKTSEGKKAVGGGAKLTYRYYLQDMAFAVALEVPEAIASELAYRLQNPIWELYLGRKSCAPTEFIYQGTFANADDVFMQSDKLVQERKKMRHATFKVIQSNNSDLGEVLVLNDVPVSFGMKKIYRDRVVTIIAPIE